MTDVPNMEVLLKDAPTNWGKWGPDDELGALNYLDAEEVLRGVQHIPRATCSPSRSRWAARPATRCGRAAARSRRRWCSTSPPGTATAPPVPRRPALRRRHASLFLQGSTQYDALGHVWYDGQLWNGYDARTTVGGIGKASVPPIAEKGVVGRGVLIDMARHRGKDWLDKAETFDHTDLEAAAAAQGVTIEPHDIL